MHWLKLLIIPLNIIAFQTEACQQKSAEVNNKEVTVKEEVNNNSINSTPMLTGTWVESGINEKGVYRLAPRRGGLSKMVFNEDGTMIHKGALNCGFGKQFEGTFKVVDDSKKLVANYNRTTKYMGPDKDPQPIDESEEYTIVDITTNTLVLIRKDGFGGEKQIAYIKETVWETMESNEYVKEE